MRKKITIIFTKMIALSVFLITDSSLLAQWSATLSPAPCMLNILNNSQDAGIFTNTSSGLPEGKLHIHQFFDAANLGLNKKHLILGLACDLSSNSQEPIMNPITTNDFSIEPSCSGDLDVYKLESSSTMMNAKGPIVSYSGVKNPIVSFGQGRTFFHGGLVVGGAFSINPTQNTTTVNTDFVVNGLSTFNNGLNVNSIGSLNGNPIILTSDLSINNHRNIILNHGDIIFKNSSGNNQLRIYSDGNIRAREIKVDLLTIPDYVFKAGYKLMPLTELEKYIATHKHLPNIKGENEFNTTEGISLGDMNMKLLEKVEELTLYTIQQQKEIEELKKMVKAIVK